VVTMVGLLVTVYADWVLFAVQSGVGTLLSLHVLLAVSLKRLTVINCIRPRVALRLFALRLLHPAVVLYAHTEVHL